jgi:hypothetical protein
MRYAALAVVVQFLKAADGQKRSRDSFHRVNSQQGGVSKEGLSKSVF